MAKNTNPADVSSWTTSLNGEVWVPRRNGNILSRALYLDLQDVLQRVVRKGPQKVDTSSGSALKVPAGAPKQVLSCTATESPITQVDRTFSQVAVSFTRDGSDPNYAGVHIWFTGYRGNSQPVLMCDGQDSPVVFNCESTKEIVTVTVQPFNGGHVSAPFAGSRTCSVALDGVVSAPPAPSIAAQTTTVGATIGQQFSFNFLPSSVSDVVLGYWIYRVGSHSAPTPPASRYQFVLHNPNQQGSFTFLDPSGVSTNFYYVSAVNKSGLESPLTDAAAGGGGTTTTYRPSTATAVSGGGFSNTSNVWDGNASTYSAGSSKSGVGAVSESWQGWASATGTNTVTLKVTSQCTYPSGASGTCKLEYSTNAGVSWTTIYSVSSARAQTTDSISISTAINLSNIRIRATVSGAGSSYTNQLVNEAWIETT